MSKELDILAKLFNSLSDDEREELMDLANKKSNTPTKKEQHNKFFDMDLPEDKKLREISKKLNKGVKNTDRTGRPSVKMIEVECKNCGKLFKLPENYPDIHRFICCPK